jgi:hypothetical protein
VQKTKLNVVWTVSRRNVYESTADIVGDMYRGYYWALEHCIQRVLRVASKAREHLVAGSFVQNTKWSHLGNLGWDFETQLFATGLAQPRHSHCRMAYVIIG